MIALYNGAYLEVKCFFPIESVNTEQIRYALKRKKWKYKKFKSSFYADYSKSAYFEITTLVFSTRRFYLVKRIWGESFTKQELGFPDSDYSFIIQMTLSLKIHCIKSISSELLQKITNSIANDIYSLIRYTQTDTGRSGAPFVFSAYANNQVDPLHAKSKIENDSLYISKNISKLQKNFKRHIISFPNEEKNMVGKTIKNKLQTEKYWNYDFYLAYANDDEISVLLKHLKLKNIEDILDCFPEDENLKRYSFGEARVKLIERKIFEMPLS